MNVFLKIRKKKKDVKINKFNTLGLGYLNNPIFLAYIITNNIQVLKIPVWLYISHNDTG